MEEVIEKELIPKGTDMETLLDFAVLLGERIQVRGGELWRTEEILNCIFRAYGVENVQIFMLPPLLAETTHGQHYTFPQVAGGMVLALGTMIMPLLLNSRKYLREIASGPVDATPEEIERQ